MSTYNTTSYDPLYTDEYKIEGQLQVNFDENTNPSSAEILVFIEEEEAKIVTRALGSHTATEQYLDVPTLMSYGDYSAKYYDIENDKISFGTNTGVVLPLIGIKSPIISITSLYKNDEPPQNAASWTLLTEGPGDGSSFILMMKGPNNLGYGIWFYDNEPYVGPKRLKVTYQYGYNIDDDILSEYATKCVAIRVLQARMNSNDADGLRHYDGGNFGDYIPTHYEALIKQYKADLDKIEEDYFPKQKRGMAFEVV